MITMQSVCPYYSKCKQCKVDLLSDNASVEECEVACETAECE